jgi:hypothetical protein
VLLKYLGTEGTGGSNPELRIVFDVDRGTVQLYRERALTAILLLRAKTITWPDEVEQMKISSRILKEFGCPHCVGIIDGTLFPLAFRPQTDDAPDYSGRKYGHSLSTMIICDDKRSI